MGPTIRSLTGYGSGTCTGRAGSWKGMADITHPAALAPIHMSELGRKGHTIRFHIFFRDSRLYYSIITKEIIKHSYYKVWPLCCNPMSLIENLNTSHVLS